MLKKILLRTLCVVTLVSFALPAFASISPSATPVANNYLVGSGTLSDPYQISNCIDLASTYQLRYRSTPVSAKSFILTNDIDCSDTINWNEGRGFLGVPSMYTEWDGQGTPPEQYFDGNNHTISGLYVHTETSDSAAGIFSIIGFGATIKNLTLSNATVASQGIGGGSNGLLSVANFGTIDNVHVDGTITAPGTAGGLVGTQYGIIKNSSSTGSIYVTGGTDVHLGGLVGDVVGFPPGFDLTTQIIDSYSTMNISFVTNGVVASPVCGGLIGSTSDGNGNIDLPERGSITIRNTYSSGTINCLIHASNGTAGGLIGKVDQESTSIENSFAASQISASNSYGFVGENTFNPTFANSFFDAIATGKANCGPAPYANACEAKNVSNSDPAYFKNNSSNAPFSTWDFLNNWQTSASYPVLRSNVAKPSAVTNLAGVPTVDSIGLTWTAPSTPVGVAITDYEINYRLSNTETWSSFSDGINANTSAALTGLFSGYEYDIRVRAINAGGEGLFADTIKVATTTAPGTTLIYYRGDGSADDPYQISTCEQLQDLNSPTYDYDIDNPANYVLVNDIDCSDTINWNSGNGFVPLSDVMNLPVGEGNGYTHASYFDGRGYGIYNLYIKNNIYNNYVGLFQQTGNLATIKNLSLIYPQIVDASTGAPYLGSLVGLSRGPIDNVRVFGANIVSPTNGGSLGGLVGLAAGPISRTFTTGTVTQKGTATYASLGGIAGSLMQTSIDNSYSNVIVSGIENAKGLNCGGLIGNLFVATVNHSYATGAVNCSNNVDNSGSVIGTYIGASSITNTFGAGMVAGTSSHHSGFIGYSNANQVVTNSFYDISGTNKTTCAQNAPNGCTGVNAGYTNPNYFKNNSTNAPLNTWDFVNTWFVGTIPTLRDVPLTPDRPENLIGVTTLNTAHLTWEAPTSRDFFAPITDYVIQYKKANVRNWTTADDGISTATALDITGLEEGVLYNYRVRAVNAAGNGIYSFARAEIQLQTKIESPVVNEFEYGDNIEYSVSIHNTSTNPIDSIDTSFLSDSFEISSITPTSGSLGATPTDLGTVDGGENWSGLLEANQELVFQIDGVVNALPNETGQLRFAGASISYQGVPLDLGEESDGMIRAQSTSFVVKETATNFEIKTSLRETGVIDHGDTIHLKYSIKNNGPKAGFFTDSSVYIFLPPSINVTQIENDYLVCSNTVLIGDNLTSGIYADLQGHVFTQCVGTGGKIANVFETITINITATATRDLNAGDVLSRSMFIAAQDEDTVALNNALSASPANVDSIFSSSSDNVSRFVYNVNRPSSQVTTTTTLPGSSTPNTPSSKDSITTNKSGGSNGKVTIKNKITESTSSSTSKVSTGVANSTYESLPEIKSFLDETNDAVKASEKKSMAAAFKANQDSPFELFWLASGLIIALVGIGLRQTLIIHRATKKLKS